MNTPNFFLFNIGFDDRSEPIDSEKRKSYSAKDN